MIIHKHKCIFVHCQKCAGESIELAISGKADRGYGGDIFAGSPEKHFSAKQYIEKYGQKMWDEYFTFSFVRNPWDRIVSWVSFRDKRYGRRGGITTKKIRQDLERSFIQNASYENLLFINNTPAVDFIGRFENLEADFKQVCDFLNIPPCPLPHENRTSRRRPYWEYYDKKNKARVETLYKKDIEYFGYEFEGQIAVKRSFFWWKK